MTDCLPASAASSAGRSWIVRLWRLIDLEGTLLVTEAPGGYPVGLRSYFVSRLVEVSSDHRSEWCR